MVDDRFHNSKWGGKNNLTESCLKFLHRVQIYYCVSPLRNHMLFLILNFELWNLSLIKGFIRKSKAVTQKFKKSLELKSFKTLKLR